MASSFTFPIIRQVFPSSIAQQIVSVQPMAAPVGAIFYEDFRYGARKQFFEDISLAGLKIERVKL